MEILVTTPDTIRQIVTEAVAIAIKKNSTTQAKPTPDRCYIADAIEITGLSKSQIYKFTASDRIPHSKFGKQLVFSRRELNFWLDRQTIDRKKEALETLAERAGGRVR